MKNFSVTQTIWQKTDDEIFIGIAPGKFDTKTIILCALAVMRDYNYHVNFVRTLQHNELKKCNCFINDDFVSLIPSIPSYHDIDKMWNNFYTDIIRSVKICNTIQTAFIYDVIMNKLMNLDSMDLIMQLYNPSEPDNTFEKAIDITISIISSMIQNAATDSMYEGTIANLVAKEPKTNYVIFPLYTENWRIMLKRINNSQHIQYVILPDNGIYLIASMDKDFAIHKHIKGKPNVAYSGRYYAKVSDINTAINIVNELPKKDTSKYLLAQ